MHRTGSVNKLFQLTQHTHTRQVPTRKKNLIYFQYFFN